MKINKIKSGPYADFAYFTLITGVCASKIIPLYRLSKFGINPVVGGKIIQKHLTVLRYFDTLTMDQGQGALITL